MFIEKEEKNGGTTLLHRAWEKTQNLPSMDEIQSPEIWINRITADETDSI